MTWLQCLETEAKIIVRHGQGKLTLDVGPHKEDQTSILIVAGKAHRFILPRDEDD